MTKVLTKKFEEAEVIFKERQADYEKQSNAIDIETLNCWKRDIAHAESTRLDNPAVMDIYMAQGKGRPLAYLAAHLAAQSTNTRTTVQKYFDLAIVVERTQ